MTKTWDYLIVTAANDQQARVYDLQIRQRREAGELLRVRNCVVLADTEGKRIGSGGSTLHCLYSVLQRQRPSTGPASFEEAESILRNLRILIVHAGGDSRRLPAYSHCGKMFVPLPAADPSEAATTLFDRLIPAFLALPDSNAGQVVVASGDALILFDPAAISWARPGITALGCSAPTHEAAHHGVFCSDKVGSVRRFLQKPSPSKQIAAGAVHEGGEAVLDVGVMSCDAASAVGLMRVFFEQSSEATGKPALLWKIQAQDALFSQGIDLYREICCALGKDTTLQHYLESVRTAGSNLSRELLAEWFEGLRQIQFNLETLPRCKFLHFGTTRQLITSGIAWLAELSNERSATSLILNSDVQSAVTGDQAWVEGCRVGASLTLQGGNAIVGVDVMEPLTLRKGACLDISAGVSRKGERVWFLRYCDIDDTFKHSARAGGTFCGQPLLRWLDAASLDSADIWAPEVLESECTLWNACVFPALKEHQEFREWLWLLDIESASEQQRIKFRNADRYSSAEIALRVDQAEFHDRRSRIRSVARPQPGRESSAASTYAVDCKAMNEIAGSSSGLQWLSSTRRLG